MIYLEILQKIGTLYQKLLLCTFVFFPIFELIKLNTTSSFKIFKKWVKDEI